jgi:antirestriction protein ArdC
LARNLGGHFGSPAYAREELRADIGSAMIGAEIGVPVGPTHVQNHAAYVVSWVAALENDFTEIFRAAADAQGICDYLHAHALQSDLGSIPETGIEPPSAKPSPALRPAPRF